MKTVDKALRALVWVILFISITACAPASLDQLSEWDVVVIGDDIAIGVADIYGSYIEQDKGVQVRVHDLAIARLNARQVLGPLQGQEGYFMELNNLDGLIQEAEVIVLIPNWDESISPTTPGSWNCTRPAIYSVRDCSLATLDQYAADIEAIVKEIWTLRRNAPTAFRFLDYYGAGYSDWQEQGVAAACAACLENVSTTIHRVASAYNIPVAQVYDAFNGPQHDEDPAAKGYVIGDKIHTSELGRTVIADLLRALGYNPVIP